jgi:hypothetical protein
VNHDDLEDDCDDLSNMDLQELAVQQVVELRLLRREVYALQVALTTKAKETR